MRDLRSRLREIVQRERPAAERRELTYVPDGGEDARRAVPPVGAVRLSDGCVAIDRVYPLDRSHGRRRLDECLPTARAPVHLFDGRLLAFESWHRRPIFFDIETTGISGGAGTLPFLVGCGWFEGDGFRVRQFFLTAPAGESVLLGALGAIFRDASLIVTFNGRTFDLPLMETRWAFHRAPAPTDGLPHFDMLPPARRLWRERESRQADAGCSLTALERDVLGFHRVGDVPGFEIPARYFHFLRTADSGVIEGVLEHNRWDLVSLAALMGHAVWLLQEGPLACREPSEQLALGRIFRLHGRHDEARFAYEAAANGVDRNVRRQALAEIALLLRREQRHDEAAEVWQEVLDLGQGGPPRSTLDRLAAEALAIHHEHRRKDPATATTFAELLRTGTTGPSGAEKARHRLARLRKKVDASSHTWWPDAGRE